ncbi:MAG: glycosyltransferase family 4 protein [Verrucomicrobia bacterium]|nr:glycosyltransferase family 4 protein [Verrucomicrobiota bacterium]
MKITILTAGTGSYYCGACMRDNSLARELIAMGHEAHLVPMYLPLQLDEEQIDESTPVFFGGINVYLQQKYRLFRKLPRWMDQVFNGRRLLRMVAKRSHLTSANEQGEMTCLMLRLEESNLGKEVDKLVDWLKQEGKPDVIVLSNALLAGLIRELKSRLGVPVVGTFQGEDSFLDSLPKPWCNRAWEELAMRVQDADVLVAPSQFYGRLMEERLRLEPGSIHVIPNGIDLSGWRESDGENVKRIGYLARMCHSKGLGLLVDAFIQLNDSSLTLAIAGTMGGGDDVYVAGLKKKLEKARLDNRVEWFPDLARQEKVDFLRDLSVFSVPVVYPEAFGLYLLEAMACGVPVVMPNASAFPEVVNSAACGVLVTPGSAGDLARGLQEMLDDPEREVVGKKGRRAVEERYHVGAMALNFEKIFGKVAPK